MLEIHKLLTEKRRTLPIKNVDKNKLFETDRHFHDWYRFVLSFPPQLVREYIEKFDLGQNDLVLDPFCGTGTTLVESKLQNVPSVGLEANHFAHFASSTKIDWTADSNSLLSLARRIRNEALEDLECSGVSDTAENLGFDPERLLALDPIRNKLILTNSISPLPLHKALILLTHIKKFESSKFYKYFAIAFANSLVYKFSNLRFGPEVGIGKIKNDAPVIETWFEQMKQIGADLEFIGDHPFADATAILSDSRNAKELLQPNSVSAVITSPPYPNEKDYTRTTRLETVLLGFVNSKEDLRNIKKTLLRSNTRGVYKDDADDEYVKDIAEVQRVANEIEEKRKELGKTSGFEKLYPRVTRLYFGGMAKHLKELQTVLRPGAKLAYVVGDQASYLQVMIRTGSIIGEIGESLGYKLEGIDLFRTRFSTATKCQLNEEVVVLSWPG